METIVSNSLDNRQYVTFYVGEEVFAISISQVQEIIRVPDVIRVPLGHNSLEGLANLRGRVLPIIALRKIFASPPRDHDDSTRILVINFGVPVGFVVDQVSSVITADKEQIESVESIRSTVHTDFLQGVIKNISGHAMVMILDFSRLVQAEFSAIAKTASTLGMGSRAGTLAVQDLVNEASDELHLVSFVVANQEYAIGIEQVQEIVLVPEQIVHVPNSDPHVIGIMMLRNCLLPLMSLRKMFSLPVESLNEKNRIVVITLNHDGNGNGSPISVGVVTDTVNEVLRVNHDLVDDMPELLLRDNQMAEISSICRLNQGTRLVSVLSAEKLFDHSCLKAYMNTAQETLQETDGMENVKKDSRNVRVDEEEQIVVFLLDNEEFGVPIDAVQEIVRVPDELTHVPKTPSFIEGVINLRGSILPVVDQRKRFDLQHLERNDRQRIMVFTINGTRTGFIVDSVSEVMKIPKSSIEEAPRLSEEQNRIMRRVANLEKQKRMIQLLDVDQLLNTGELGAITSMNG